ncbi:unnamed protein product [Protopolystoma xenopodis]|uniref:Uncharacterized protein n=1 Tax=Protopolystoma xenopodis TaxID=117903 RepID=A0A448WLQ8_9PLAT|nr:unnamed protein product [Protopolystoma xenopodis]
MLCALLHPPVRPVEGACKTTTSADQYDEGNKRVNVSSLPVDSETTKILRKGLNFSLQNGRDILEDNLMEAINISDKFPEEKKRDMEMAIIPRNLTH